MTSRLKKTYYRLGGLMVAGMVVGSGQAFAAGKNFTDVTKNMVESSSYLPQLISTFSYILGILFTVLGILKIKDHVNNAQTPIKEGAIRLAAGGALLAAPMMFEAVTNTIGIGTQVSGTQLKVAKFALN